MTLLTRALALSLLIIFSSCATMEKSSFKRPDLVTVPNSDIYTIIGSIKVKRLYFDPLGSTALFDKEAGKALNTMVPDALYDLDGDICWITDFRVKTHSLKCIGLCSEVSFNVLALKHK